MPGVPLDIMDKFKALFSRKKKPAASGPSGTQTDAPKPTETATAPVPAVPAPAQTPQKANAPPSSADPGLPQAGAAPVDAPKIDKPATTTPSGPVGDPVPPVNVQSKPQVSEAAAVAAPPAPTSTTV